MQQMQYDPGAGGRGGTNDAWRQMSKVNATGSPRCVTAKVGICTSKNSCVRNTFSCLCFWR